ncbi:MAG TPA: cytochrome c-type biogenesis protein CcmH, partial [Candidatus Acidoferrales bacterium]|nr:cytochrome c-type biogenesis protein CcmH [Candidatus Acidoferrales bacterium]
ASLLLVASGSLCVQTSAASGADDLHEREARVAQALIAPCCFMQTLANHSSPIADQMKREIHDLLQDGWSEDVILDYYLYKYGERILATPRARGFNVMAYLIPPFFVLCAAVVCVSWMARHRSRTATAVTGTLPTTYDPRFIERMTAELERLD